MKLKLPVNRRMNDLVLCISPNTLRLEFNNVQVRSSGGEYIFYGSIHSLHMHEVILQKHKPHLRTFARACACCTRLATPTIITSTKSGRGWATIANIGVSRSALAMETSTATLLSIIHLSLLWLSGAY